MQSELHELCGAARSTITVPAFPLDAIRHRIAIAPVQERAKSKIGFALATSVSLIAVAAAAGIVSQSHIDFTHPGGMVLHSEKMSNRAVSSDSDITRAAAEMNFEVTLPQGLPVGSKPIRLFVGDRDVLAITYDLPGAWRASHHLAWVFLANPASVSGTLPATKYALHTGDRMKSEQWQVGGERVIVVSNGLTQDEVARMKAAMGGR